MRLLDNIVDYLTYAFAPMVLLWVAAVPAVGCVAEAWSPPVPLVASCYQFSRDRRED